jgi:hypothetical protein
MTGGDGYVYLAGWHVTPKSFTIGTFGSNDGFHMYPLGAIDTLFDVSTNWKMAIGSKFGITANGEVYTIGGKIGGWNIDTNGFSKDDIALIAKDSEVINSPFGGESYVRFKSGTLPGYYEREDRVSVAIGASGYITSITCNGLVYNQDYYYSDNISGEGLVSLMVSDNRFEVENINPNYDESAKIQITIKSGYTLTSTNINLTITSVNLNSGPNPSTTMPSFVLLKDGSVLTHTIAFGSKYNYILMKDSLSGVTLKP